MFKAGLKGGMVGGLIMLAVGVLVLLAPGFLECMGWILLAIGLLVAGALAGRFGGQSLTSGRAMAVAGAIAGFVSALILGLLYMVYLGWQFSVLTPERIMAQLSPDQLAQIRDAGLSPENLLLYAWVSLFLGFMVIGPLVGAVLGGLGGILGGGVLGWRRPPQTTPEQSVEPSKWESLHSIANGIAWIGRLASLLVLAQIAFVLFFFVGEGGLRGRTWEYLILFFLTYPGGVFAGMVLAWWRAGLGGIVILVAIAGWLLVARQPGGAAFWGMELSILIAVLFLASSLLRKYVAAKSG